MLLIIKAPRKWVSNIMNLLLLIMRKNINQSIYSNTFLLIFFLCLGIGTAESLADEKKSCDSLFKEQSEKISLMTIKEFDQTPGEGWRALDQNRCYEEGAKLIQLYREKTNNKASQLYFHAGQLLAMTKKNEMAIQEFEKSLFPENVATGDFLWNDYVKGTIAFVARNRTDLKMYREKLAAKAERNRANLRILDKLLERFEMSYVEALQQ